MLFGTGRHIAAAALSAVASFECLPLAAETQLGDKMELGVQTHFSQGWRLEFLDLLPELGAVSLRDEVSWQQIEFAPGQYQFSGERLRFLPDAVGLGVRPLIVFTDTNPFHDDGNTPWTKAGRNGFSDYVVAVLDQFGDVVDRIEIGNEFNSDEFVEGPFADDKAANFAALLKDVHLAVKAAHPETEILCTGTHSVAIGFFRALFENGALAHCDAISFHPYRDRPEHLGAEIGRLRDLMAEFGEVLPIYATEFGKWFDDPDEAPGYMMKMVAIMGDAGVEAAWWYALLDQPWWPNMGLYHPENGPLPGADAFRLLQKQLLPEGRPHKVSGSPLDMIFEFGTSGRAFVAWGAQGRLLVEGEAQFFDARGREIGRPEELSDEPVIILGENLVVTVERDSVLIDVAYGFGMSEWSYLSRHPDGNETPLSYLDGNWSSVLGDPWLRPLLISSDWISGALFDNGAHHAVERFTAKTDGPHLVTGVWFQKGDPGGDGADILISSNGNVIATGIAADDAFTFGPETIELLAGDTLDFAVGPNVEGGDDAVQREIRIAYPPASEIPAEPPVVQ
jgi:hypothetical protein